MTDHDHASKPAEAPAGPPTTPVIAGILLFVAIWAGITTYKEATRPAGPEKPVIEARHGTPAPDPHAAPAAGAEKQHPAYWSVLPFVLLLAAIAIFPLWGLTYHWWESNSSKFTVAGILALVTLVYYAFVYANVDETFTHLWEHTLLGEYIPFIVLLFSLFTIAGGIRISGDQAATPFINSLFMLVGAVMASFVGTTGAAMLLIRALLETNSERKNVAHTVVFFIFIVCNTGGLLLPIGDPPLFLGYLLGVDFLWTFWKLWFPWLVTNSLLIAIYYVWDAFFSYPAETPEDRAKDQARAGRLSWQGLWPNVPLLLGVILAVAFLDPKKTLPFTNWQPWDYLRECVMLGMVALSLALGSRELREKNSFNYNAILEVAALFIGIFITMRPALDILDVQGHVLGVESPLAFFWATGSLSSVLDNAPTYVVFLKVADSQLDHRLIEYLTSGPAEKVALANGKLMGISLGAVFMGSMTYIGNGPNFMVRSIAEESGVQMPSFFGYVFLYSFPVLLPVFALVSFMFLQWLV